MLRYNRRKFWTELPVKLLYGRSDFQIIPDFPSQLVAKPNMFSKLTQISQNDEAEAEADQENWRNSLGSLYRGERLGLTTNIQRNPWLQLDLDFELFIVLVILPGGEFKLDYFDYFPFQIEFESGLPKGAEQRVKVCTSCINILTLNDLMQYFKNIYNSHTYVKTLAIIN